MKGFIEHLIASSEEVVRDLAKDYDRKHSSMSHAELLAMQLSEKVEDKDIIESSEQGLLKILSEQILTPQLIKEAGKMLEQQERAGINTVSFLDCYTYPQCLDELGTERPVLLHYVGDIDLCTPMTVSPLKSANLYGRQQVYIFCPNGNSYEQQTFNLTEITNSRLEAGKNFRNDVELISIIGQEYVRKPEIRNCSFLQQIIDNGGLLLINPGYDSTETDK